MEEEEVSNKQVVLKNYVSGFPEESDFEIINSTIKLKLPKDSSAILVKNLYLSCDPFFIPFLRKLPGKQYLPLGTPILGLGICKVLHSTHPNFNKGDLVSGFTGWEEFSIITKSQSHFKIHNTNFPLSYYTGIFGLPGLCAYIALYKICNPKKEEGVFISTASGITGQLVGQFAKLLGCYVVASADSRKKIDFLKNTLSFDNAFNDKEEVDLVAALKRYFSQGIDICFDNVRGEMLDAVLANMRYDGRIVINGPIYLSNPDVPEYFYNFNKVKANSILMKGFSVNNYFHLHQKYMEMILPLMKENKVIYMEDIVEGLENGPSTLIGISSQNVGTKVLHVARE